MNDWMNEWMNDWMIEWVNKWIANKERMVAEKDEWMMNNVNK